MKSKYIVWSSIVLMGCVLAFTNCSNPTKEDQNDEPLKAADRLEKKEVLNIAEEIAFKEYGDVIKKELPLKAQLAGDSMWIVQGTLPAGSDGGTLYIELSKGDHKILKITHYK